jgi:CelD/BcsL family acetyltransferase involved in cellulose biosynthesis
VAGEEFTAEVVTTNLELEELWPYWDALYRQSPNTTPFQSPAWLIPWWRSFGKGTLFTVCVWRHIGDVLAGILPLYLERRGTEKRLLPLGISSSDYCDGLFAPHLEASCAAAALNCLVRERSSWDVLELPQLRESSFLLRAPYPPELRVSMEHAEPCSTLSIPPGVKSVNKILPRHLRRNLKYYKRRVETMAPVNISIANLGNLTERLEDFFTLHQLRAKSKDIPGVFADPVVAAYHRMAMPYLQEAGLLRLITLYAGQRAVAAAELFADPHPGVSAYLYLTGFDPHYAEYSPGTLIIAAALEQSTNEHYVALDLLRGEESYKKLWGARSSHTFWCRIFSA